MAKFSAAEPGRGLAYRLRTRTGGKSSAQRNAVASEGLLGELRCFDEAHRFFLLVSIFTNPTRCPTIL